MGFCERWSSCVSLRESGRNEWKRTWKYQYSARRRYWTFSSNRARLSQALDAWGVPRDLYCQGIVIPASIGEARTSTDDDDAPRDDGAGISEGVGPIREGEEGGNRARQHDDVTKRPPVAPLSPALRSTPTHSQEMGIRLSRSRHFRRSQDANSPFPLLSRRDDMDSDLVASLFPRVVDLTQLAIANSAHALESEQKQQKLAQNVIPPHSLLAPPAHPSSRPGRSTAHRFRDSHRSSRCPPCWRFDPRRPNLAHPATHRRTRSTQVRPISLPHKVFSLTLDATRQELADLNEFIPTALDNDAKMND